MTGLCLSTQQRTKHICKPYHEWYLLGQLVYYTLYTVHCTLYIIQCIVYYVQLARSNVLLPSGERDPEKCTILHIKYEFLPKFIKL